MPESSSLGGLLQGTRGLVVGVANQNSIAWACARALHREGMELAFTYQGEIMRDRVVKTIAEIGDPPLFDLDVRSDEQIASVFEALGERWGKLDFLLHAVAYAPKPAMSNPFIETTRSDFLTAHDVSAYSLVALTRGATALMTDGGSIVTMTYYGSQKAVPGYNVMGVAKASLEASVRYLAIDLGALGIRINAISAGAVNTLAARGVSHFRDLLKVNAERAPLGRAIAPDEIANATLFLASKLASGITGDTMYVDAGFNITAG